jgi:hypothetical protein
MKQLPYHTLPIDIISLRPSTAGQTFLTPGRHTAAHGGTAVTSTAVQHSHHWHWHISQDISHQNANFH